VTTTLQRTTKPLLLDQKVIVGFADGFVGALSFQEGSLLWETKIVENAKFVDVDLNPILAGPMVVTGSPSGELMGINPQTGAVAMNFGVSVMSHPYLRGQQLLVGTNDGEVMLLSLSGEKLKTISISKEPVSAVTWWKDHIIAASFDGKLRAIDPLTSQVVDSFEMGYSYSSIFSDLVTTDDYLAIYSSRNHLYIFR
jgi:outer membrane protein assembly factor BamB